MGIVVTVVLLVIAAGLLIGAVVLGVLRNNRTRGLTNTAANAVIPAPVETPRP